MWTARSVTRVRTGPNEQEVTLSAEQESHLGRRASKAARSGALVFMAQSYDTCRKAVPLIDVNAYLITQQMQRDLTRSSRPDAPARLEQGPATHHVDTTVRRQLGRSLRRQAEIIQPDGTIATVPLPASR